MVGNETSATALGNAFLELAKHPEVQQKLRIELLARNEAPSYDDLQSKYPYLNAVLHETYVHILSTL